MTQGRWRIAVVLGPIVLMVSTGSQVPSCRADTPDCVPRRSTGEPAARRRSTITRFSPALAFVLLAAGSAHCADVVRFKGTMIAFRVEASSVKGLTLTASALCLAGSKGTNEIRVIPVDEPARLVGDGHFTLAFDKSGTRVSVSGRVAGSAAEGRFEVHYTKTFTSYDVVTRNPKFEIASCSARAPWTARREGSTEEPPR